MAYADYAFYKDVYLGNVATEEEFPRIAERASAKENHKVTDIRK